MSLAQALRALSGPSASTARGLLRGQPAVVASPLRRPSYARKFSTVTDVAHQEVVPHTQQGLPFNPFDEVKEELAITEAADLSAPGMDNSFARLGYHGDCEVAINEQINVEYNMSYVYHAMASYFNRDNVALPGLATYFRASSLEERSHAQQLMDYQAKRGGRVKLAHIGTPLSDYSNDDKGEALHAMELALSLERLNFAKLRELHEVAEKHNDQQMQDFVEEMLAEQVDGVKEVADYVAQLRRVGKGHGTYHFDRDIMSVATDKHAAVVAEI